MSKIFDVSVRQSNDFVESAFAQEYSEQEIKTMEFLISQTKKSDIELAQNHQNKLIEISVPDFANMINAHSNQIYREANNLAHSLINKKYHFKFTDNYGKIAFKTGVFLTDMEYQNGMIKFSINSFVLPYFIEINERFTEFNLRYVIAMGSSYAIKIYKLLKQYQKIGTRIFVIEELKKQLGIFDTKYKLYGDFKRRVLEVSRQHINNYTDINIDYDEVKLSRKVTKIKFYIKPKITQFKQAQLAFLNWVDSKPSTASLKSIIGDLQKNKKDIFENNYVTEQFEWYLSNKIYNYDPNSCEPLQHYEPDTLFGQID